MQKILSVLIPTYNNNESLKKVLDSYVGDKRIEILVSDDSDDEDKKMLIKDILSDISEAQLYHEENVALPYIAPN